MSNNTNATRYKSITAIVLSTKLNRFSELSICGSGGSSNVGIGKFKTLDNGYEVLNDMSEQIAIVDTFEEVLETRQIKDYVELNVEYKAFLKWHKSNPKSYYVEDKTFETALMDFNQSKVLAA
mgnify:CR=1 FL=1